MVEKRVADSLICWRIMKTHVVDGIAKDYSEPDSHHRYRKKPLWRKTIVSYSYIKRILSVYSQQCKPITLIYHRIYVNMRMQLICVCKNYASLAYTICIYFLSSIYVDMRMQLICVCKNCASLT